MKILLSLVMLLGFWNSVACRGEDTKPNGEKTTPTANAKTWAGLDFDRLILDLQDDKRRLWLGFNRAGSAVVIRGQKEGWITCPMVYWKINREWLQIFKDSAGAKLWFQMRMLNRTKKMIRVENEAGEKQIFAIKRL